MSIRIKNIGLFVMLVVMVMQSAVIMAQQSDDSEYNRATRLYYFGKFDEARECILSIVNTLPAYQQLQAYRMMASMALYDDELSVCEQYVAKMLQLDPYYNDSSDDPRLMDIVNNMKRRSNTLSTASSQSETLEEAPVPVTVITEEMIKVLGPRSLQDILAQYVPGMNIVDGQESNIAMRGIYAQNQEAVYLLQDGHRLNSQSTNSGALDYRINVDKIKRIEVLRGPASSLYGNAALTAVVNIITKEGIEVDGNELSLNVGSFDSYGASFVRGKGSVNTDFLLWASVYNAKGEKVNHDGFVVATDDSGNNNKHLPLQTTRYLGGYNGKLSCDIGMKMRWDDFTANVSYQQGKRVPYNNTFTLGDATSYDVYPEVNGYKPGLARNNMRFSLDYNHSWKKWFIRAGLSGDIEHTSMYNVLADSVDYYACHILTEALSEPDIFVGALSDYIVAKTKQEGGDDSPETKKMLEDALKVLHPDSVTVTRGVYHSMRWGNTTYSASLMGGYNYGNRGGNYGSLLFGLQYDYFHCDYARIEFGEKYGSVWALYDEILNRRDEYTISAFGQWKHNFGQHAIVNLGMRYDGKHRYDGEFLNTASPRLSFIWLPNKYSSLKAGYSHSFVDASYFNRASLMPIYNGDNLRPERMDAFQLGYMASWNSMNLHYEANMFYNIVNDLVFLNHGANALTSGAFQNTGRVEMLGLEQVLSYNTTRTLANINTTWQKPLHNEGFVGSMHQVCNVPDFMLNFAYSRNLLASKSYGNLWLDVTGKYKSSIRLKKVNMVDAMFSTVTAIVMGKEYVDYAEEYTQYGKFTMNMGLRYIWRNLSASLHCYNLWNTSYVNGGLFYTPEPSQSRSLVGKVSVRF